MKRCTECQRHLMVPEPRCPFCGADQAPLPSGPGPALGLALALGLSTASCTEPVEPMDDGSGDSSTTVVADSTTTPVTATSTTAVTDMTASSGNTTIDPTGESSAADAPGTSFVEYGASDGGGVIFECDLWAQDCPEGEKCMPWANDGGEVHNATRCAEVAPDPGEAGDPCNVEGSGYSGIDTCELGAMCFGVDPTTNEGHCVELCENNEADPTCSDPAAECSFVFPLPLPFCLVTCDPLASACPDGFTCAPLEERFACLPQAEVPRGETCDEIHECDPGSVCVESMDACGTLTCCVPMCDLDDPGADAVCMAAGTSSTCTAWFAPEVMSNVGACVDP